MCLLFLATIPGTKRHFLEIKTILQILQGISGLNFLVHSRLIVTSVGLWQKAACWSTFLLFPVFPSPYFSPILNTHIYWPYSASRQLSLLEPLFCAVSLWGTTCMAPAYAVSWAEAFTAENCHRHSGSFSFHHLLGIWEESVYCREGSAILQELVSLLWPAFPW